MKATCALDPEVDACGGLDDLGECNGSVREWCDENGDRKKYDCASSGMTCKEHDDGVTAAECIAAPCDGVDYLGTCDGDVLNYCMDDHVLVTKDCQAEYGLTCGKQSDEMGMNCLATTEGAACGPVTFEGTCSKDTVVWCNKDTLDMMDCAQYGMTCGDSGDQGMWCIGGTSGGCGDITFDGECQGDVAVWCDDGALRSYDCAESGMGCGPTEDQGNYCTEDAGGGGDGVTSCEGHCGETALTDEFGATCYCDEACTETGDCCGGDASYNEACPL
jgi:hypothetical protein